MGDAVKVTRLLALLAVATVACSSHSPDAAQRKTPVRVQVATAGPARRHRAALLAGITREGFHAARISIWIGPSARPWTNWLT